MAYRRKYGNARSSAQDELRSQSEFHAADEYLSRPSLAAHSIQASPGNRESSLPFSYGDSAFPPSRESDGGTRRSSPQVIRSNSNAHQYASMKSSDQSKYGLWDVVTRKARSVLEDDNAFQQRENSTHTRLQDPQLPEGHRKKESPKLQKGLNAITSSLSYIGGKVGNALEEGFSVVENQTADIIQETRKLNIRRKERSSNVCNHTTYSYAHQAGTSYVQTNQEIQLKAARDVANAMAAKAKLLMRELKTVKSDLTFAKERCAQLEDENKFLREMRETGVHPEDDDLIRLQLETLLAEKARLAHENSVHTRENRFLREIVEYHQLTMQDVVYVNEGIEEVSEVYSISGPNSYGAPGNQNPWLVSAPNNSSCTSLPVPVPPLSAPKTSNLPECAP